MDRDRNFRRSRRRQRRAALHQKLRLQCCHGSTATRSHWRQRKAKSRGPHLQRLDRMQRGYRNRNTLSSNRFCKPRFWLLSRRLWLPLARIRKRSRWQQSSRRRLRQYAFHAHSYLSEISSLPIHPSDLP
nr:hypothetical protein Itr_chr03CG23680 [Ipomoea trifida]